MKHKAPLSITVFVLSLSFAPLSQAAVVDDLLTQLQSQGAGKADVMRGMQQWTQTYTNNKEAEARSCSSCHTKDLHVKGKHVNTGKAIDPLAPSVNAERLTDVAKIEKWLKRNCKWTLGRECTAQEKTDLLSFIRQQ